MKNLFVPLDIFRKTMENKDINTELEAWLTFLSTDDPEQIYNLIRKFPMFKEIYEDIFRLCQNTERVMNMYSKELAQLDHNTAEYMVDEMQKDLDEARSIIREKD
ncbi:MAG: PD-(D/E)XK nuclease family transposase, partial [Eubacterium sp.]|nr:PD-(D/E)XK nuclease family transposase [Eubacterium sp.]